MDGDSSSVDDETMNVAGITDDSKREKKNALTIINTNARSLCPKIDSLVDCFEELEVDVAVITETWLKDSPELDQDLRDLEEGAGISSVTLNRLPNHLGVSHGGVAVLTRKGMGNFKKINVPNPDSFEVLPVIGSVIGSARKLVVIGIYIPPNYTVPRGNDCLEYVENLIIDIKARYQDPYILVAGDFNQWAIDTALSDFPDLSEVLVGPTRGDRSIDRIFCNITRGILESGTVPPLESESSKSDHRIAYLKTALPRTHSYEWVSYTYRHFTPEAEYWGGFREFYI